MVLCLTSDDWDHHAKFSTDYYQFVEEVFHLAETVLEHDRALEQAMLRKHKAWYFFRLKQWGIILE